MAKKQDNELTVRRTGRRPYRVPALVEYGDVRQLTQGGTAGALEAGNNNSNFMD